MSKVTRILVTALFSLLVTACGQKGNLVQAAPPGGSRASLGQALVPTLPQASASAPADPEDVVPPLPLPGR